MSDEDFIILAMRYLDQAAAEAEVEQLGEAMLGNPARRAIYRDLAQQASLSHEWHLTKQAVAATPARPITRLMLPLVAAAAALAIAFLTLTQKDDPGPVIVDAGGATPFAFPEGTPPSWKEIYPSLFDYPDFVWLSELHPDGDSSGTIDAFSELDPVPGVADLPAEEFRRLLEPIALLPSPDYFPSGGLY